MEHQKTAKDYIYWHCTVEPDGCWSWDLKGRNKDGYAFGTWPPKHRKTAHRIAYEAYHGPVPPGLLVLHTCDRRDCVNPDHLYAGTQSHNMKDASKRGRLGNASKLG